MILGLSKLINIPVFLRSSVYCDKMSTKHTNEEKEEKNSGKNIMIKSNYIAS